MAIEFDDGVVFLSAGAPSMAVGAGLFGYAVAHEPSRQQGVDMALFVPGAAVFGIGIPFVTVGTMKRAGRKSSAAVRAAKSAHAGEPVELPGGDAKKLGQSLAQVLVFGPCALSKRRERLAIRSSDRAATPQYDRAGG